MNGAVSSIVGWVVTIGAVLAALAVIGKFLSRSWKRAVGTKTKPGWIRRAVRLVDELAGLPPIVTGLTAAVLAIQREMHPNGGSSMRDSNDRIERALGTKEPASEHSR